MLRAEANLPKNGFPKWCRFLGIRFTNIFTMIQLDHQFWSSKTLTTFHPNVIFECPVNQNQYGLRSNAFRGAILSRKSSFLLCKTTVRVGKFMLQHLFWSTTFPLILATLSCWFSGSFTIGPRVKKHKENQTNKSKIFDIWKVRLEDGQPMFTPSIRASLD